MVFKRVNRSPLEIVEDAQLDADMTAAIKAYFTRHGKLSDLLAEEVEDLFYNIKSSEQWVLCDCRRYRDLDTAPLLHPVEGPILRRHIGEKGHIEGCAFLEPKGERPLSEDVQAGGALSRTTGRERFQPCQIVSKARE